MSNGSSNPGLDGWSARLDQRIEDLRSDVQRLRVEHAHDRGRSTILSWLIGVLISLVVGLGVYKILLDPHPLSASQARDFTRIDWKAHGEYERLRAAQANLLLDMAERQLLDAVRNITFAGARNRDSPLIQNAIDRMESIEPLLADESSARISSLLELARSLKLMLKNDAESYREAIEKLEDAAHMADRDSPIRYAMFATLGAAMTMSGSTQYNSEAMRYFEKARSHDIPSFKMGLPYNGRGIQRLFLALSMPDSRVEDYLREFEYARLDFRRQDEIDRTYKSEFTYINNTLVIFLHIVKTWLDERRDGDESDALMIERALKESLRDEGFSGLPEGGAAMVTAAMDNIASKVDQVIRLDRENPNVIGTSAEYWSLRGELAERAGASDETIEKYYDEAEAAFIEAIRQGLYRGKYDEAKEAIEALDRDRLRAGVVNAGNGDRREAIVAAIRRSYQNSN